MTVIVQAPPVAAAPLRSADEQARLGALAEALGRAHALHRLCAGPADDRWRAPMQRLLEAEHATPALRDRLVLRFNAGFAGVRARRCGPASRAELAQAAAQGRDLARGLAGAAPAGSPP
ncbi:MAG: TIGR02301 family protein [Caulobacteraceae bacterium]|nr:TIGR02301 family protein [Caulobacter sp.]